MNTHCRICALRPRRNQATQHARDKVPCEALRADGQPTRPSSIDLDLAINPFLRCSAAEVVASANVPGSENDSPVAVLTALREWKKRF